MMIAVRCGTIIVYDCSPCNQALPCSLNWPQNQNVHLKPTKIFLAQIAIRFEFAKATFFVCK